MPRKDVDPRVRHAAVCLAVAKVRARKAIEALEAGFITLARDRASEADEHAREALQGLEELVAERKAARSRAR